MKRSVIFGILAGVYFLIGLIVYLIKPGSDRFLTAFGDTLPVIAAALAVGATAWVAVRFDSAQPSRSPWAFLALGLFLWWLGEAAWWVLEVALREQVPYPSVADIFWFAGYAPLFIAFVLSFWRLDIRLSVRSLAVWFLPLGLVLVAGLFAIVLPVVDAQVPVLEKFLSLVYPFEDILLLAVAFLTLAALGYGVLGRPWKFVVSGLVLMLTADLIYTFLSVSDLYKTGSLTDLLWMAGYLIIGVGASYQMEILS